MGPGSGGSFGSGVSCGGSLMGACSGLVGRCPPILSMLSILASGPRDMMTINRGAAALFRFRTRTHAG
jgi:hypothetical protein